MEGKRLERIASEFVGAAHVSGKRHQPWFFASLIGFTNPGIVARYEFSKRPEERWSIYRKTSVTGLNSDDFLAEQVCIWLVIMTAGFAVFMTTECRFGTRVRTEQRFPCSSFVTRTLSLMVLLLLFNTVSAMIFVGTNCRFLYILSCRLRRFCCPYVSVLQPVHPYLSTKVWVHPCGA